MGELQPGAAGIMGRALMVLEAGFALKTPCGLALELEVQGTRELEGPVFLRLLRATSTMAFMTAITSLLLGPVVSATGRMPQRPSSSSWGGPSRPW